MNTSDVPVFILCGGLGTRLKEETEFRPKPMVPIGEHPILWHVMQVYAQYGFRRFVLCLGFKAEVVKDYFRDFHLHNADCTIRLKTNEVTVHEHHRQLDWEVTLAGKLNLHGVEKPITLPVRILLENTRLTVQGELFIAQTDFGIKPVKVAGGTVKVKDRVKVSFTIVAERNKS